MNRTADTLCPNEIYTPEVCREVCCSPSALGSFEAAGSAGHPTSSFVPGGMQLSLPQEQTSRDKMLSHCMGGGIQLPRPLQASLTSPRVDLAPWPLRRPRPPAPGAQQRELAPCASGVQFAGVRARALCCPCAFPDFEPTLPPQRSLAGPRRESVASDSPTAGAGLWPPAGARGSPSPGWQCQTANRQQKSTSSRAIAGHAQPQAWGSLGFSCDSIRRSGPGDGEEAEYAKRCRRPAVTCEGRV